MIEKIIKKIYYEKYTKKSYAYSHVDLVVDKMFSKINKGFYSFIVWKNRNWENYINLFLIQK